LGAIAFSPFAIGTKPIATATTATALAIMLRLTLMLLLRRFGFSLLTLVRRSGLLAAFAVHGALVVTLVFVAAAEAIGLLLRLHRWLHLTQETEIMIRVLKKILAEDAIP
jgi:hypothetical protein